MRARLQPCARVRNRACVRTCAFAFACARVRAHLQVAKGHLRLDHPELGQVASGVRLLGTEGWAEGVDVAQRARVRLRAQLQKRAR
eukprot:392802-Pleurochrysis_carterae.AAC.1